MKTISVLKRLIIIYYYFILIALVGIIFMPLLYFLNIDYYLTFSGNKINISQLKFSKAIIIMTFLGLFIFIYFKAIRFIKISLKALSEGNYFSYIVIRNFKKSGQYFIFCAIAEVILKIAFSHLLNYELKIEFDSSVILFILIGLFLMFLSEVFSKGKNIQQENDLTI